MFSVSYNDTLGYVYFTFPQLAEWVSRGDTDFTLSIEFTGNLTTKMRGFYRSSYVEDGIVSWIATTGISSQLH